MATEYPYIGGAAALQAFLADVLASSGKSVDKIKVPVFVAKD